MLDLSFVRHKFIERRNLYRSVQNKTARRKMIWSLFSNEFMNKAHVFRIEFMTTLECNAKCGFCSNHKMDRSSRASPDVVDAVFRRCIEHGVPTINFLGGEALLDEDIFRLVKQYTDAGIVVGITTNGTLLDRERLVRLKEAGIAGFSITIHDAIAMRHDLMVGFPAAFERVLDAIREAKGLNLRIGLQTIYSRKTVKSGAIDRIIHFARQHNLPLKLNPIMPVGGSASERIMLTPEQHAEMKQLAFDDGRITTHAIHSNRPEICPMGRTFVGITPKGDMQPCYFLPLSFGNVKDVSFGDYLRYARRFPIFNKGVEPGYCLVAESRRFFREVLGPIYKSNEQDLPIDVRKHPEIEAKLLGFAPTNV
jgi:MoaA/NifB/PqqE/SkfB family radical SAM enzyme